MSHPKLYTPEPASAPGDFYNVQGECLSCGVPQMEAPDLVGWLEQEYAGCYWIKQPETPEEFERAFKVFTNQDVGCHRYAGRDPLVQLRIGYDHCDHPQAVGFKQIEPGTGIYSSQWGSRFSGERRVYHAPGPVRRLWQRITRRT